MAEPSRDVLLVRSGARLCALPVADVVETMRRLQVAPLAGTPSFVDGVAVVRGEPAPVVNLDRILGGGGGDVAGRAARFVRVRCGARAALLAVDEVLGVRALSVEGAPPLLSAAAHAAVEAVAAADGSLLVLLRSARLVPDHVLDAASRREVAAAGPGEP